MASLVRPTAGRAVHLRITPRPSNLGESREIMRLLSQFGEVEYFKNLKYDELPAPNTALMIYKDEEAAQECLRRSPIRFRMGKALAGEKTQELTRTKNQANASSAETSNEAALPRGPVGTPFGLGTPSQTRSMSTQQNTSLPRPPPNPNHSRTHMPFSTPTQPSEISESRIFQIQTNPSSRHFRDQINVNHYHGPFAIDTKMVGQGDLAKKVPTPGLSCVDWKAMEKPWHVVKTEKEYEHRGPKARRRLGLLWEEAKRERNEDVNDDATDGASEKVDKSGNSLNYNPEFGTF